jgi:putative acetyltransferase
MEFLIKRTTSDDKDFLLLVKKLDHELWVELEEEQATYDQYNKVPDLPTAIIVYENNEPVACGCFKTLDSDMVEIKRMFVSKEQRGKGLSKKILGELEQWAREKNHKYAVLETSIHFTKARNLYTTSGYEVIPNYGPYTDLPESICMKKLLQ